MVFDEIIHVMQEEPKQAWIDMEKMERSLVERHEAQWREQGLMLEDET